MFNFFRKAKTEAPDLSFLGADMHSHLLPGLDDGLKTMDQTMAFMRELQQMGYKKLICTPHILSDMHPNSPGTILPVLAAVKEALSTTGIAVEVEAAAEYMIDMEFERLIADDAPLLTFGGERKYILIEMSYLAPSPNVEKVIFNLQMKGLKPIFAHPERYKYYHTSFNQYQRLQDLGCLLQVNLLSLSGYYGKEVKKVGELLLRKGLISFLGTDMHHERHMGMLKELIGKKEFRTAIAGSELLNHTL